MPVVEKAGYNCLVLVAGNEWFCQKVSVSAKVGDGNVTHFGSRFTRRVAEIFDAEVTLDYPTYNPTNNPFGVPVAFTPGLVQEVFIYMDGLLSPPWHFPELFCLEAKLDADANTLSPIQVRGASNDEFFLPGEEP